MTTRIYLARVIVDDPLVDAHDDKAIADAIQARLQTLPVGSDEVQADVYVQGGSL